jgi:hypothetical protein
VGQLNPQKIQHNCRTKMFPRRAKPIRISAVQPYCCILNRKDIFYKLMFSYVMVQRLLSSSLLPKNLNIKIYITIILPVVLYGCETWSLTLREDPRLRVFENRVLSWIFGPKREQITGEMRKLYSEELRDMYFSSTIVRAIKSRRIRWAGHLARM